MPIKFKNDKIIEMLNRKTKKHSESHLLAIINKMKSTNSKTATKRAHDFIKDNEFINACD